MYLARIASSVWIDARVRESAAKQIDAASLVAGRAKHRLGPPARRGSPSGSASVLEHLNGAPVCAQLVIFEWSAPNVSMPGVNSLAGYCSYPTTRSLQSIH